MIQLNTMIAVVILITFCIIGHLQAFAVNRLSSTNDINIDKRAATAADIAINAAIVERILAVGNLNFNTSILPDATEHRKIACFFVFDKEASAELNNNLELATNYSIQLATLASKYAAHANIVITSAGTEIWANADRISFAVGSDPSYAMPDFLSQFQAYLANTQKTLFGIVYAVGVLISNKTVVAGGYSQGPPCTTSGASLINFNPYPWSIAGLLAHELAHTLSVVHPFELSFLCEQVPALSFCPANTKDGKIPDECTCDSSAAPPQQCLMTFQFGRATPNAPTYTSCDIKTMNYFSSGIPCLIK